MSGVTPGWYPDQASPGGALRWWDGTTWTDHRVTPSPTGQAPGHVPGPTTDDGRPLAGWWARVGAFVIDTLAVGTVAQIFTIPLTIQMSRQLEDTIERSFDPITGEPLPGFTFQDFFDGFWQPWLWAMAISLVLTMIYHAAMLRWRGATVGKIALGLRVRRVDDDGRLPWSTVLRRVLFHQGLLGLIGWFGLSLLDGLWPLWDRRRQALHDKVAGTLVVRDR